MKKKKKLKSCVLKYATTDRVLRWNYCQQLAKHLYNSDLPDERFVTCLERLAFETAKIKINVELE